MIVFLTVLYLVVLFIAFKLKWIKPTLWWKLSPIAWTTFLLIALFIPMQFWAPAGPLLIMQHSVQIVPNVQGEVIDVNVGINQPVKEGDVLFRIDPVLYQSKVDTLKAQLNLARTRLEQARQLADKGAGSAYDVEQYNGQVEQLEAQLDGANNNLDDTTVVAPADGYVTSVALREGARVANFPISQAMAFIESGNPVYVTQIHQNHLRYIVPGIPVELTFKMYPGQVFDAVVDYVVPVSPTGQVGPSGMAVATKEVLHTPFWVMITPVEEVHELQLPVGATGSSAIYTNTGQPTHVIRKVMIRLEAIKNYIMPF